jgi:hypothetical protein
LEAIAFGRRSPSLEGPTHDLSCFGHRLLIWAHPMKVDHFPTHEKSGFEIVCKDCGRLSIKVAHPVSKQEA